MIDLDNQTSLTITLPALEKIASVLSIQEIELLIVDDATMHALNLSHRDKACTTDVLSFPLDGSCMKNHKTMPLGSIVIAASYVISKAKHYGHTEQDELSLLFIHGMLHLLGYDHEIDRGEMRHKEESLIKLFHLPKSLIVRTAH